MGSCSTFAGRNKTPCVQDVLLPEVFWAVFHTIEKFFCRTKCVVRILHFGKRKVSQHAGIPVGMDRARGVRMINWLVKVFIKDSENTTDSRVRTAYGMLGGGVAMVCNLLLFLLKFGLGMLVGSVSVMADAFNNLSDSVSNIISLVGVKMAGKPADEDHPFGHGRMEYIVALIVAFLVVEVGVSFLKEAIQKILHPETITFQWIAIVGLVLSIGIKLWLGRFNGILGKKINSKVMEATATDAIGDVLATTVTVISILVYYVFHINLDGYAGLIVALFIIWAGVGIVRETIEPLLGTAVDPLVYRQITQFVEGYEGICGTHDLIVHNYGPAKSMASIHAEVSSEQNILESHELIDRIEKEAKEQLGIFLVIHMDPVETNSQEVTLEKTRVETIVRNLDSRLSIHDFRLVNGEKSINLIFDMVVPFSFGKEEERELKRRLEEILWLEEPRYHCVITYDRSFVMNE